jgi:transcriptional regulator with XRE-family HTH domain
VGGIRNTEYVITAANAQLAAPSTICQSGNMQLTKRASGFSVELRRLRAAAGLSQRSLARRCGLTAAYISLLEAGRRTPERAAVERIAAALDPSEADRAALFLAAGFVPTGGPGPAPVGELAEVAILLADPAVTPRQRALMTALVTAYAQGLADRARAGKPLVSDLAAPWQQRILETLQEKMADDFDTFRDTFMRPAFDL